MDEVKHIFPKGCGYTCPYRDAVSGKCERHRPTTDEIVGAAIEGFRSDMKRIMAKDQAADCNPLAEPLRRALLAADNLLSELDAHQDITGEHLEDDDQAIVDGAKEDMAYAKAALKRHRALCDLAENDADLISNETPTAPVKVVLPRHVQFSGSLTDADWDRASAETERLTRELNITNADHVALWLETNMADSPLAWLACRIVEAHEATQAAYPTGVGEGLPADVIALVVAGREAWEIMASADPGEVAIIDALDKALERFASRVCYDDEGGSLPEAHANPCTCGAALTPADARKGEGMGDVA